MRIAALAGLLAAAVGCNQVFGLETPGAIDAVVIPPDGPPRTVQLTWQVARTSEAGIQITYPALAPSLTVMLGPIPGESVAQDPSWPAGMLRSANVDEDGGIDVPDALLGQNWRLVYSVPGETAVREVYWAVARGHLVVERFGPLERTPPPDDSSYLIPTTVTDPPRFFTTGVFTQIDGVSVAAGLRALFAGDSVNGGYAHSMSGPLGVPDVEPGYRVAACGMTYVSAEDYATKTCGVTQIGPLVAGQDASPAAPVTFDTTTITVTPSGFVSADSALRTALSTLYVDANTRGPEYAFGLLPTMGMASFTDELGPVAPSGVQPAPENFYTRPVFFELAHRSTESGATFVEPMLGFPDVALVTHRNFRKVNGVSLVSSVQALFDINLAPGDTDLDVQMIPPAPRGSTLAGTALDIDKKVVTVPAGVTTLSWTATGAADLYEVTLYEITGTTPTRLHVWTVFDTHLAFDTALSTGKLYAFEIAARTGMAKARSNGDFTIPNFPHGRTSVFAGTFCVAPGPCP